MTEQNSQNQKPEKKKGVGKGIIIAIVVVALIAIGAIICYFMGLFGGIDESEARSLALSEVPGATEEDITYIGKEFNDGIMEYNVQIMYESSIYEMSFAVRNGSLLNKEMEYIESHGTQDNGANQSDIGDIGIERARKIALGEVSGASESDVMKSELDNDDGRTVYEVEIVFDGMEYDFKIDATTGEIISRSSESAND